MFSAQPERDPPVAGDRDPVLAATIAPQSVQPPARHGGHLRKIGRELKRRENRLDLPDRLGGQAARIVILVQPSQPLVPKPLDQHV
jgi:hypothetical protein